MQGVSAVLLCVVLAFPHLSADKVSDKAVQVTPCHDWTIPVLIREVIWLRLITNTKHVWECDSFSCCIKLRCNIWHIVLIIVVCAKSAVVWEGCVWSCVSSCLENVSDAHHPKVTARGRAGDGTGSEARRESEVKRGWDTMIQQKCYMRRCLMLLCECFLTTYTSTDSMIHSIVHA